MNPQHKSKKLLDARNDSENWDKKNSRKTFKHWCSSSALNLLYGYNKNFKEKQARKKTKKFCEKCNLPICKKCFEVFHTKSEILHPYFESYESCRWWYASFSRDVLGKNDNFLLVFVVTELDLMLEVIWYHLVAKNLQRDIIRPTGGCWRLEVEGNAWRIHKVIKRCFTFQINITISNILDNSIKNEMVAVDKPKNKAASIKKSLQVAF